MFVMYDRTWHLEHLCINIVPVTYKLSHMFCILANYQKNYNLVYQLYQVFDAAIHQVPGRWLEKKLHPLVSLTFTQTNCINIYKELL